MSLALAHRPALCRRRRIVILEDEATLREIVSRIVAQAGYETVGFGDIEAFRADFAGLEADLVILDLALGEGDGVQILHFLAATASRAAVLLVSGFDSRVLSAVVRLGRSLGLAMLTPIEKPIRPQALLSALESVPDEHWPLREADLEGAIEDGDITLCFQPKVALGDGALIGAEALVRWRHAQRGMIAPDSFIPMAERGAQITPLTYVVLRQALGFAARWRAGRPSLSIAVNISAKSLCEAEFVDAIDGIAAESGLDRGAIVLEVTETAMVGDSAASMSALARLRIKGYGLALDDFGTGYSSLVEIHRMPFSELKIDKSFVLGLETDADARTIVRAMVGLGRNLGMKVVAEGVETAGISTILRDMGCDVGQGYHFARPMPPEAFADFAVSWRPAQRR